MIPGKALSLEAVAVRLGKEAARSLRNATKSTLPHIVSTCSFRLIRRGIPKRPTFP